MKVKSIILTVLCSILGLMLANSGFNKFFGYMPMPEIPEGAKKLMGAYIESGWMMPFIAVGEIIGGILFILPKTRALGAIIILPITVAILLFHIALAPDTMAPTFVFLGVNIWAIVENKEKYLPIIK